MDFEVISNIQKNTRAIVEETLDLKKLKNEFFVEENTSRDGFYAVQLGSLTPTGSQDFGSISMIQQVIVVIPFILSGNVNPEVKKEKIAKDALIVHDVMAKTKLKATEGVKVIQAPQQIQFEEFNNNKGMALVMVVPVSFEQR